MNSTWVTIFMDLIYRLKRGYRRAVRKISLCIALIFFVFYSVAAQAGACIVTDKNGVETGEVATGRVNISNVFNIPDEDIVGMTKDIMIENDVDKKTAACTCENGDSLSLWDWTQFEVPTEEVGGFTYGIINDYLGVAIQAGDSTHKTWIPYENNEHQSAKSVCNNVNHDTTTTGGGGYVAKIRIRKRIVGEINVPPTGIYVKGSNTYPTDSERKPEIRYFFHGSITVPQNCELDVGQTITMDFGNIGASAFQQAGAGNRPAGVNPQTHNIAIQCKNIDAQALLSLRVEANKSAGNAIVSDNPDLGFVVADSNHTPLTPNTIDSKIPFKLDDNASANVPISAWPVSVTGNRPAEGKFTSEGYLRVDFD